MKKTLSQNKLKFIMEVSRSLKETMQHNGSLLDYQNSFFINCRQCHVENVKDLWDELKERLSKEDFFKISYLFQNIHSIKQGDINMAQFFT